MKFLIIIFALISLTCAVSFKKETKSRMDTMAVQNQVMNNKIADLTKKNSELLINMKEMASKNSERDARIDDLSKKLDQVIERIFELSTRPLAL